MAILTPLNGGAKANENIRTNDTNIQAVNNQVESIVGGDIPCTPEEHTHTASDVSVVDADNNFTSETKNAETIFKEVAEQMEQKADGIKKTQKITSAGWYRVAKYHYNTDVHAGKGILANGIMFNIKSASGSSAHISNIIGSLAIAYGVSNINIINSKYNGSDISKIRHVVDTTTNTMYLEVYTNGSILNLTVEIMNPQSILNAEWEIILEATSETATGVDVYSYAFITTGKGCLATTGSTEYTLTLGTDNGVNIVGVTSTSVPKYRKENGFVSVYGEVKKIDGSAFTTGSSITLGTLPTGFRPSSSRIIAGMISNSGASLNAVIGNSGQIIVTIPVGVNCTQLRFNGIFYAGGGTV